MLSRALADLARGYAERYGVAVFDVAAEERDGAISLRGTVLLPRQAEEAVRAAREASGRPVRAEIAVLADAPARRLVSPRAASAWLRTRPADGLAREVVATEALAEEPALCVLHEREGWLLLRRFDGTLGWLRKSECAPASARADAAPCGDVAVEARRLLGAPYLWGGVGGEGVDCSGLVQTAFRRARGVALPRHSTDMARAADAVAGPPRPGDLAFGPAPEPQSRHVGLFAGATVIHSSFRARRVIEEPLDAFCAGTPREFRRVRA